MSCAVALVFASLLANAPPKDPWQSGEVVDVFDAERMRLFFDDEATADFSVSIVVKNGKDELDIGISNHSFTLDELERFFKFQRHKDFIVVTYHKNAPVGELRDSIPQLKKYFQNAGYKRILLTHGTSSGRIIHEDFRPESHKKTD